MIPVTKPFLPPLEEYKKYLDQIWHRNWLTNMGPLSLELEEKLKDFLEVKNLLFVTNGTIALQMAIKALNLKGEIITTPFSFVATTSTIVWEGCSPVFVDIDEDSLNIDPTKIEEAITEKTSAILATHVYGNPCDVEAIEKIAKKHNLKVIYDGAHAFGVKLNGKSIFEYGDISICSLHATKLYHSVEGGFLVTNDAELNNKLSKVRNFGISSSETFSDLGINGKNSELHAAMGLCNLNYITKISTERKMVSKQYDDLLLSGKRITKPKWHSEANVNYAYYPIILENEKQLLYIQKKLEEEQIFTRRYFYPALSSALPYLEKQKNAVAESVSERVLCLPLYTELLLSDVVKISNIVLRGMDNV